MTQETVKMSARESDRLRILAQVEVKAMTLVEAAELMGVSYRHAKRLRKRALKEGAWGLAHRLRGRVSNRRRDEGFRRQVLDRYRERYIGFGPTLACEKLAEDALVVGRETLRRWLMAEGLWVAKQNKRRGRRRRARREHFGELVQIDGSDHDWFEGRGPRCCLEVMIDDATGKVWACFGKSESLALAMATLAGWIQCFDGVPQALYADRLSLYHPLREPNEAERRSGSGGLTQFGAACWRLGARMIKAGSAQAKGRVERMNGTLQDRLVKEMRLLGVSTIEEANAMLEGGFLDDLNERFSIEPLSPVNYHRSLPEDRSLEDLLCLESTRQVQNDWTIPYGPRVFQILEPSSVVRAKTKVTVRLRLDGSIRILQGERELRFEEASRPVIAPTGQVPPLGGGWGGQSPSLRRRPVHP